MSTRSITQVESEFDRWDWKTKEKKVETMPLMRFYRHCDGYPEGHGYQMAIALAEAEFDGKANNRNWAQVFLAKLCAMDCDIEFEPPTLADGGWCHGDIEYLYTVHGMSDYTFVKYDDVSAPGRVVIEIRTTGWDMDADGSYKETLAQKPMFSGTWRDYAKWLRSLDPTYLDFPYEPTSWITGTMTEEQWERVKEESL